MIDILNWLFGLEGDVRFGTGDAEFGWARPVPAWGWALIIAGAAAAAFWSYTRIDAPRRARGVLASLRALLLILLAVMISGPRLELERTSTERDWLYWLVDRSASLTIPDAPDAPNAPGDPAQPEQSRREDQLRSSLGGASETLASLASSKRAAWIGFDASAYDLPATDDRASPLPPGDPAGRRTSINTALEGVLRRAAAKPVSGIVLFSDGRAEQPIARGVLNRLLAEQIPVFTVPLGSDEPRPDWLVRSVRAPSVVFAEDVVPFEVTVDRRGEAGDEGPPIVELVDAATGQTLDRAPVGPDGTALLDTAIADPGERTYRVHLAEESTRRDLIESNNAVETALRVVDDPIRVLYLDGAPRWEQRYLKSLLLREDSIASTSLILAPSRRYQQEGNIRINALPVSPEEWAEFDVVIVGDMRGGLFGTEQLEALKRHVADRGAGLLWLGGPTATPGGWRDTPLADLLPMRLPPSSGAGGLELIPSEVTLARTEAAERLGLLELGEAGRASSGEIWAGRVSNPATGWSRLRWAQRIDPSTLKPATQVFARAVPVDSAEPTPLLLSMRFGAGRAMYLGTDEIWRWRYGRGESLNERFWLPLIRLLARERVERAARGAVLEFSPREPVAGTAATVTVRIFDQALLDAAPSSVRVGVSSPGDTQETLRLEPAGAERAGRGSAEYTSSWFPARPGTHTLETAEPILSGMGLETEARVVAADDELREPATDHALLTDLAERTGGAVVPSDELDRLPELLPNRARVVIGTPSVASLWDTMPFLAALVLLASAEWIIRRLVRLT